MPETADSTAGAAAGATGDTMAHTVESDSAPKPAGERRRPRKKLSFREPEIVGCEKYRQMKERSAGESIIKTSRDEPESGGGGGGGEPAESRPQQPDGGQETQTNGQREQRRDGRPAGVLQPERHRGGSLDSQLSVRLVLRPGAAGETSIETEMPPAPARRLPDSPSLGSMDDLDLQDEALEIVRSVGLAFEMSQQCPLLGAEQPPEEADTAEEPEKAASPAQLSAESPSSASGDDTPRQTDVVSNATTEQSTPQPPSPPAESAAPEATPPPAVTRHRPADGTPARERLSRRERLPRSPDKRHLPPAAATRRYHSLPRPPRGGMRGVQPLSPLVAGQGPLLDDLAEPWPDRRSEPASLHHQIQLVYSQLAQQQQQTQAAQAQANFVRHQLQAETAARLQAQRRSHQLLEHNRQLLEHVQQLVGELQQLQADRSETVSPDTSFASLSSEEATRTDPSPSLQLLWDLERLSGGVPLSTLGQRNSPASPCSQLDRLAGGVPLSPLGQYGAADLSRFAAGPEPLFDLGQFSSAPPSPLSRTDPLLSDLSGVGLLSLSPLAMEESAGLTGARMWQHGTGVGTGTLRRSAGHHRHAAAARHAPTQ